jgi:hypothetical protein
MTRTRTTYMPLASYPEAAGDGSIQPSVAFASSFKCTLHVTTFAVAIPEVSSALGSLLLDVPGLICAAEEKSKAECHRLKELVYAAAGSRLNVDCSTRKVVLRAAPDAAAAEARYYDLAVLPWSGDTLAAQGMTHAVVFGSGRRRSWCHRRPVLLPSTISPSLGMGAGWPPAHLAMFCRFSLKVVQSRY